MMYLYTLDANVRMKIVMLEYLIKLSVYQKIHLNRDAFIIKLKHQVNSIEKVIITEKKYSVVEKNNSTPEPGDILNSTTIDNS